MDASQAGGRVDVALSLELLNAAEPQTYRLLTFLDERQVGHGVEPFTLGCGEQKTLRLTLEADEAHALNVVFRNRPLIPPVLEGETPQSLPDDFAWTKLTYAFPSVETLTLGENPPVYAPGQLPVTYIETESGASGAAYLFLDDPARNDHVQTLSADEREANFNIFFDAVAEPGLYSLTCTLNDQQVAVFSGENVWSGPIEQGQAVILPATAEVAEPGWHQLRCFVLNHLYTVMEPDALSLTYPVDSLYIYKEAN